MPLSPVLLPVKKQKRLDKPFVNMMLEKLLNLLREEDDALQLLNLIDLNLDQWEIFVTFTRRPMLLKWTRLVQTPMRFQQVMTKENMWKYNLLLKD